MFDSLSIRIWPGAPSFNTMFHIDSLAAVSTFYCGMGAAAMNLLRLS
jgi:hypothetical protein